MIANFISDFNDLSQSNQFSDSITGGPNADIVIKFIHPNGMSGIPRKSYPKEFRVYGMSYAKIGPGTISINAELKGDERDHTVLRSVLYALGFRGDTINYPDSFFSSQGYTNTKFTFLYKKTIQVMYSAGLSRTMTVENVTKELYLK